MSKLVETRIKDRVVKARETAHSGQGSPVGETTDFPPCIMVAGRKWHHISPSPPREVLRSLRQVEGGETKTFSEEGS